MFLRSNKLLCDCSRRIPDDPYQFLSQVIKEVASRSDKATNPCKSASLFRCAPLLLPACPKIIFDTDIGSDIDDTIALLTLLHSPCTDYKLLGITTVYGCVELRKLIAERILEAAGVKGVPVIAGIVCIVTPPPLLLCPH